MQNEYCIFIWVNSQFTNSTLYWDWYKSEHYLHQWCDDVSIHGVMTALRMSQFKSRTNFSSVHSFNFLLEETPFCNWLLSSEEGFCTKFGESFSIISEFSLDSTTSLLTSGSRSSSAISSSAYSFFGIWPIF